MRLLFLGDVVGKAGCKAVVRVLPRWIDKEQIDLVIANGENAYGGSGLDPQSAQALIGAGVAVITSGNHIWRRSEIVAHLNSDDPILRPVNYAPGAPGRGWLCAHTANGTAVGVVNVMGRVFMDPVDDPFQAMEGLLPKLQDVTKIIVVDVHAEATSEKAAIGCWLDGKVAAVLGTHTHVQTADERILPGGTAFMTDVGMCGPIDSVIGVRSDLALRRFRLPLPVRFEVAPGPVWVQGALVEIDALSGRATAIRRVREVVEL